MFRFNLVGDLCSESKMLVWCIDPALKWPLFLGNRWWRTKRQAGGPRAVGQPGRGYSIWAVVTGLEEAIQSHLCSQGSQGGERRAGTDGRVGAQAQSQG